MGILSRADRPEGLGRGARAAKSRQKRQKRDQRARWNGREGVRHYPTHLPVPSIKATLQKDESRLEFMPIRATGPTILLYRPGIRGDGMDKGCIWTESHLLEANPGPLELE